MTDNLPVKQQKVPVPIVNGKFAPTDFDGLWRLAVIMSDSNLVPDAYKNKPADAFVAMQMGMEVGLGFMASLQNIAVVRGKPTVYADGVTGLIQSKGHLEYMDEGFKVGDKEVDPSDLPLNLDEWPDNLKAFCHMKRNGQEKIYKGSFSVADAKRINKWNKATKTGKRTIWQQWPARMLTWRARTFPCRDGFSDDLKGLSIYEEVIDYDADLEKTNGHYEVPVESGNNLEFQSFCQENSIDEGTAMRYVNESAKMVDCPAGDLIAMAISKPDAFLEKFTAWIDRDKSDNDKSGSDSKNTKSESQNANCPNCDVPECKGCTTVEVGGEEAPKVELIDEVYDIMYLELNKINAPEEPLYEEFLGQYVEYVSELTKQPKEKILEAFTKDSDWFEFFMGWIDEKSATGEGQDASGAEMPVKPEDQESPGQSPVKDGGLNGKDKLESLKDAVPQSFKKQWIGKPGKSFKPFVLQNPGKFDPDIISKEEYHLAVDKWNTLVKARTGDEWPYGEQPTPIEFPKQEPKQALVQFELEQPAAVKKSKEFRGFAKGGLSNDAAKIVLQDVLDIMGGKVLKK